MALQVAHQEHVLDTPLLAALLAVAHCAAAYVYLKVLQRQSTSVSPKLSVIPFEGRGRFALQEHVEASPPLQVCGARGGHSAVRGLLRLSDGRVTSLGGIARWPAVVEGGHHGRHTRKRTHHHEQLREPPARKTSACALVPTSTSAGEKEVLTSRGLSGRAERMCAALSSTHVEHFIPARPARLTARWASKPKWDPWCPSWCRRRSARRRPTQWVRLRLSSATSRKPL